MTEVKRHTCDRNCIFSGKYWYSGEIYEQLDGMPDPPKHFSCGIEEDPPDPVESGSFLEIQLKEMTATNIAKKIMLEYGVKLDTVQTREQLITQAMAVITDPQTPRHPDSSRGEPVAADLPAKCVSELSPDEIETTTRKQMVAMIKRDRGIDRKPAGSSKAGLFELDAKLARGD